MMRKTLALLFILLSMCSIFLQPTYAAKQDIVSGIYTTVKYTSELFPNYEKFTIEFFVQRTKALNIFSNETLYIKGYRIVLNTTLIAYVRYESIENYIPELQKIKLEYDRTDWNLTQSDYNSIHRLTLQISAVAVDTNDNEHKIADDLITADVYFMREANSKEILNILLITNMPLLCCAAIFTLRKRLDANTIENVTYTNMLRFLFRRIKKKE